MRFSNVGILKSEPYQRQESLSVKSIPAALLTFEIISILESSKIIEGKEIELINCKKFMLKSEVELEGGRKTPITA